MTLSTAIPSWFSNTDTGAPQLNNAASSLIEVLRACLVTGFNAKAVTNIAVASGVATVTCATHGYTGQVGKLVLIAGASAPLLNGRKQPTSTGPNTFTYPAPGVADGTYTGTMDARRAPLGWTEEFAGQVPNVAVFRQSEVTTDRVYLRVSDVLGATARIVAYETMSDANNGVGPTPSPAQVSLGVHWYKSDGVTIREWQIIGSSDGFYIVSSPVTDLPDAFFAGRINRRSPTHPFAFAIVGVTSVATNQITPQPGLGGVWISQRNGNPGQGAPCHLMRGHTGLSGPVRAIAVGAGNNARGNINFAASGNVNYGAAQYPNPANNGLHTCLVNLYTGDLTTGPGVEVGNYPGMLHIAANVLPQPITDQTLISGTDDALGKTLLALVVGMTGAAGPTGEFRATILFNMTDPWSVA